MFNKALSGIESFIDWSGRTVSWLSLFLVLVTFIVVVLRYVFDSGSIALGSYNIFARLGISHRHGVYPATRCTRAR
jgi:TRAP-type mannitol/chloroaromatic compound transport system permease small subunit